MAVLADKGASHSTGRVKRTCWERLELWQKPDFKKAFSKLHREPVEEPRLSWKLNKDTPFRLFCVV